MASCTILGMAHCDHQRAVWIWIKLKSEKTRGKTSHCHYPKIYAIANKLYDSIHCVLGKSSICSLNSGGTYITVNLKHKHGEFVLGKDHWIAELEGNSLISKLQNWPEFGFKISCIQITTTFLTNYVAWMREEKEYVHFLSLRKETK